MDALKMTFRVFKGQMPSSSSEYHHKNCTVVVKSRRTSQIPGYIPPLKNHWRILWDAAFSADVAIATQWWTCVFYLQKHCSCTVRETKSISLMWVLHVQSEEQQLKRVHVSTGADLPTDVSGFTAQWLSCADEPWSASTFPPLTRATPKETSS